jgi:selenide, water dikinase
MLMLNSAACEAMLSVGANACTDVTGFGLLGHAREMALASNVTLEISAGSICFLPGAIEYSRAGAHSGGLNNNRDFVESCVMMTAKLSPEIEALLYDPQTSGGLLISLPESHARELCDHYADAYTIGRVRERGIKPIEVIQ